MKHTPEPWTSDYPEPYCLWIKSKERVLAVVNMDDVCHDQHDEDMANGKRIVACVNACAGMEDPVAEISELRELAAMYKDLCR